MLSYFGNFLSQRSPMGIPFENEVLHTSNTGHRGFCGPSAGFGSLGCRSSSSPPMSYTEKGSPGTWHERLHVCVAEDPWANDIEDIKGHWTHRTGCLVNQARRSHQKILGVEDASSLWFRRQKQVLSNVCVGVSRFSEDCASHCSFFCFSSLPFLFVLLVGAIKFRHWIVQL